MIKKLLISALFLLLSLFLIVPVHAAEPPAFQKTTDVFVGDLDYRNSLVDWNGYNIDIVLYWSKQGGLPPSFIDVSVVKLGSALFTVNTWDSIGDSIFQLRLTNTQKNQLKGVLFSRIYEINSYVQIFTRTITTAAFLMEVRVEFKSLLNINLGSIYVSDSLFQSHTGLLNGFSKTVDIVGVEDTTGSPVDFVMQRITLDTELTQPISSPSGLVWQRANYNFITKYTNVGKLYYNVVMSANSYDPATASLVYYLNQLGFFADSQVILPDLSIDTDFQIYEPTTCSAIDIACVSRNLIGEFSNNIYKRFGAETIASGVMDIYDTIFYPVYMIDNSAWQNGVISIYGIVVLGVLYLLLKRNL